MLYNRTHFNKDEENEINNVIGNSFSFLQILKLRGIGSSRFVINSVSINFHHIINKISDTNYCSIELRPKGIIVNIIQQHNLFSWIIPYYRLVIFDSNTLSIHSNGSHIKITKDKCYSNNKNFIKKMLKIRQDYL